MCPGNHGDCRQAAVEVRMTTIKSLIPPGRRIVCLNMPMQRGPRPEALGYASLPEINIYDVSTLRLASTPIAIYLAPFVMRLRHLHLLLSLCLRNRK